MGWDDATERQGSLLDEYRGKAVEQGNSEGQLNLGKCLFYGDGCEKNEQEASNEQKGKQE